MPGEGGFNRWRGSRNTGLAPSGAASLRSQAATNVQASRRGGAAAAPGIVQPGSIVDYPGSVAGTDQVRRVALNTAATDYKLGEIVEIPHLVLAMDPHEEDDDYKVKSRVGEICPKWRPAVIVAIYQQRMTVLPIYTCKEKGVSRKPDHYKTTAMSIAHPSMLGGSNAQYLTEEVLLIGDSFKGKQGQHVNLNEPVSVSYAWPITKLSRLGKESTATLYKRYRTVHHMGTTEPPIEHEKYFRRKMQEDKASARARQPKPRPQVDDDGFTIKSYRTDQSMR